MTARTRRTVLTALLAAALLTTGCLSLPGDGGGEAPPGSDPGDDPGNDPGGDPGDGPGGDPDPKLAPLVAGASYLLDGAPAAPAHLSRPPPEAPFRLEAVATNLSKPVAVAFPPGGDGHAYVVEKPGTVRVVGADGAVAPEPFLNVSHLVARSNWEQGLLNLAFDPAYSENGRFYIAYTANNSDVAVARYTVRDAGGASGTAAPRADPGSGEVLLRAPQPTGYHNGGGLAFGPNGYLWLSLGDGTYPREDPPRHEQRPETLPGSLLRMDVRPAEGYAIPPDNPFADGEEGAPEVWAYGLRNPWRFSFDRATGDLFIGDVGAGYAEEVNYAPAGSPGGANYGWDAYEAEKNRWGRDPGFNATPAVAAYSHAKDADNVTHCAITGGHVYRGDAIPDLQGVYLYADFCSGTIWGLGAHDGAWAVARLTDTDLRISSWGQDGAGELYVTDHDGGLHKLVPK